jgi:hypothetical protein
MRPGIRGWTRPNVRTGAEFRSEIYRSWPGTCPLRSADELFRRRSAAGILNTREMLGPLVERQPHLVEIGVFVVDAGHAWRSMVEDALGDRIGHCKLRKTRSAGAAGESGSKCATPVFEWAAGIVQVFASKSMSRRRARASSPRRCPVRSRMRIAHAIRGDRSTSSKLVSKALSSASARVRSFGRSLPFPRRSRSAAL